MQDRSPAWEIPITVLEQEQQQQEQQKGHVTTAKLVLVDKPLLGRLETMRAKQQRLQKYAVLSLGIRKEQPVQQQLQQQQQQQDAPRRRPATRLRASTQAANAGAETAAPDVAATAAPSFPSRETAYDCWQLGSHRLVVRSHGLLERQLQEGERQQFGEQLQGEQVLLAVSPEYLPEPDLGELCVGADCVGADGERRHTGFADGASLTEGPLERVGLCNP